MAGTRRMPVDGTRGPPCCQSEDDVALPPRGNAEPVADACDRSARPSGGPATGRERHRVHLPRAGGAALRHARRGTCASTTSPIPPTATARRPPSRAWAECPDWIVAVGEAAEQAWTRRRRSASRRRRPTTATAPSAAATRATTSTSAISPRTTWASSRPPSPIRRLGLQLHRRRQRLRPRRGGSAHDDGRRAAARDGGATSCSTPSRSASRAGGCRSGSPRRPAVWMEGIVAPPDVDREIYRVALGGGDGGAVLAGAATSTNTGRGG